MTIDERRRGSYCGLAVVTKSSADYRVEGAGLRRAKKSAATRGLTRSHNRTLKYVFKGAAQAASRCEPFKSWYAELLTKGLRPELARVTTARKIAAVTLAVWKSGARFEAGEVMERAV